MTRAEAIAMQKAIRDNLHETGKDYPYRDDMIPLMKESCNMAIQALEQEPIHDILDKIRAEIDSYCSDNRDRNDGLYIAMRIIDKYKAERREKEWSSKKM